MVNLGQLFAAYVRLYVRHRSCNRQDCGAQAARRASNSPDGSLDSILEVTACQEAARGTRMEITAIGLCMHAGCLAMNLWHTDHGDDHDGCRQAATSQIFLSIAEFVSAHSHLAGSSPGDHQAGAAAQHCAAQSPTAALRATRPQMRLLLEASSRSIPRPLGAELSWLLRPRPFGLLLDTPGGGTPREQQSRFPACCSNCVFW